MEEVYITPYFVASCCEVCGNTSKKRLRTITHSEYIYYTVGLFNRLGILKMNYIIAYKCLFLFSFKAFHNLLPVDLNSGFVIKCIQ